MIAAMTWNPAPTANANRPSRSEPANSANVTLTASGITASTAVAAAAFLI